MKKKKENIKLLLKKKTIIQLSNEESKELHGGNGTDKVHPAPVSLDLICDLSQICCLTIACQTLINCEA